MQSQGCPASYWGWGWWKLETLGHGTSGQHCLTQAATVSPRHHPGRTHRGVQGPERRGGERDLGSLFCTRQKMQKVLSQAGGWQGNATAQNPPPSVPAADGAPSSSSLGEQSHGGFAVRPRARRRQGSGESSQLLAARGWAPGAAGERDGGRSGGIAAVTLVPAATVCDVTREILPPAHGEGDLGHEEPLATTTSVPSPSVLPSPHSTRTTGGILPRRQAMLCMDTGPRAPLSAGS